MEIQSGIDIRLGDCLDQIICGDNVAVMQTFPDACIDLTVTSPPYDNLRKYQGYSFDFEGIASQLWRVTKPGGVVVWVVGDATVNGSETGASFRQALRFMEIGFKLHDTMIYEKAGTSAAGSMLCYLQVFEYMLVLSKGRPQTINILRDRRNKNTYKYNGRYNHGRKTIDGQVKRETGRASECGRRFNIWRYSPRTYGDDFAKNHPAPFAEALARDHILSWSNPGDVVLDPFNGSGTTAKMALANDRHYIGIDISQDYCDIARRRLAEAYIALGNIDAAQAIRPVPKPLAACAEQMRLF